MSKSNNLPVNGQGMSETKQQTTNFTQISNEVLLDERLSFKARGILALLLSRPKNWKIYIDEIIERSTTDGKHAVRTGFKELKKLGYVELVKVWNKESRKFEGTVYQLCLKKAATEVNQKNLAPKKDFPTTDKTDQPKPRPTENPSVEKADRPKSTTPSNKEYSNTKHSNTKKQQQQRKTVDDAFLKNSEIEKTVAKEIINKKIDDQTATALLPSLQNDAIWKKQFIGKNLCKQVGTNEILTADKFDCLLKHFAQTSISSGTTYPNIAAIKRHFFNWFNANLNKNALSNYIEQQSLAPKKAKKQIQVLIKKSDAILNKIYGQQCENEAHLYRCLQLLATHIAVYQNALDLLDKESQTAVNSWILEIENVKNLVERGRKAGQLAWFFTKNSKPKTTTNSTLKSVLQNTFQGLQTVAAQG